MAANLRPLCRKLQTALAIQQGRRISINTYQAYSTKAGRTVTKYILSEHVQQDGSGSAAPTQEKYHTLFQSWSLPDVVRFLADELQKGGTPQ